MSLMIKNAHAILSGLPGEAARLAGPDIRIRDGKIAAIGSLTPLPEERQIDARDCVIYPAWVNTHHHLFQSLLKGEPQGLNQSLTAWLSATPYRFRAAFDEHTFRLAVRIGLVELLRSGCASVADHNYLYWPDMPFDTSEIVFSEGEALGMRIVLCRGGATQGRAVEQDLPVALRPETFDGYMADIERLVSRYPPAPPERTRRSAERFSPRPERPARHRREPSGPASESPGEGVHDFSLSLSSSCRERGEQTTAQPPIPVNIEPRHGD